MAYGAILVAAAVVACSSTMQTSGDSGVDAPSPSEAGASDGTARDARRVDTGTPDGPSVDAGTPYLTSLTLAAGDGGAAPTLVPAFSSTTYDYYVACGGGANALSVAMTASAGALSRLTQPITSPSAATQTLSVSVAPNQAIVAEATSGAESTAYWVRCLPPNFPKLQMTTFVEAGVVPPGYYLVGNYDSATPGTRGYAMVLDGNGVPVWYGAVGFGVCNVDSLDSGILSFIPSQVSSELADAATSSPYRIATLAPPSVTTVSVPAISEHELRLLPNGNRLLFSFPVVAGVNLTGLSLPLPDGGTETFGPGSTILDSVIFEQTPEGATVWSWSALDHFDPVTDLSFRGLSTFLAGTNIVEPFHCNSIDVDPDNGNLLVSCRNMDSVFYVRRAAGDPEDGRVLWKMGGSRYSKDNAQYVEANSPFHRQHDARLQTTWRYACNVGTGQISVFDDETDESMPARGVVYDVDVPTPREGGEPMDCGGPLPDAGRPASATLAWSYEGTASVDVTGSFRTLPDGTRLIGWGFGRNPATFTELDDAGTPLRSFVFVGGNWTYRAIKVPLGQLDLNALRATAGTSDFALPSD